MTGRRRVGLDGSMCAIEDVRRRSGLGGEGARFEAGIRDRFSTLAAGPSRPAIGGLREGERVEDADTKVSSDEVELADVRLMSARAAGSAFPVLGCNLAACSFESEGDGAFGSCAAGGLSDGFVTVRKLSPVAPGRTAGGCRLGLGASIRGFGDSISVVARRTTWGGVFVRSGAGRGLGFGGGRSVFCSASACLSRPSPSSRSWGCTFACGLGRLGGVRARNIGRAPSLGCTGEVSNFLRGSLTGAAPSFCFSNMDIRELVGAMELVSVRSTSATEGLTLPGPMLLLRIVPGFRGL